MNIAKQEYIQAIFVDNISDPQTAMRSEVDRDGLWELADDIKKNGLINPITVRPKNGGYEVIAGHRRLSACKIAGLIKISCVVRDVDDAAAFGIMASENLVREDVDPVDESTFIFTVMNQTGQSAAEVAKTLRRSIGYVEDRITIANMPDYLRNALKAKSLKLGVALALNKIMEEGKRHLWSMMAIRDGVSVKQAEYWLYQWQMSQLPDAVQSDFPDSNLSAGEHEGPMFICVLDGKKYPAMDTVMICVAKNNMSYISALRAEIRKDE